MFKFSVKNITFDGNGEVYVKYPLGNVKYLSKENWKLSQDLPVLFDELERNIGHDLTILKAGNGFVHPYVPTDTSDINVIYNNLYNHQQPYVIGKNDQVYRTVDDNGFIWGRYHITNSKAKEYYKQISDTFVGDEIPLHSSIMLVLKGAQPLDDIKHFRVVHNAVVDDPQFGFESRMRAICVGEDKQCNNALLAAGGIPCNDTKKQYKEFFNSFNTYILSASNKETMSEQEQPKPEDKPKEDNDNKSGNVGAPINWRDEVKKVVDDSITKLNIPSKVEIKAPGSDNDKLIETKKPEQNQLPETVINDIINRVASKYDTQIKELTGKLEKQDTTLKSYESERKEANIGRMLLEYQDFFRGNDGKIDNKLFDENLKYWSAKQVNEEDIKLDLEHSFDIAKKYITNLSVPVERTVTKETASEPLDKRERIMKEVEDEQNKLGVVQKAGNVERDELEEKYQNILSKKGNNDKIVNSNDRIY